MKVPEGLGTTKDLRKRFDNANTRYQLWRSIHQEAFDFANPERETFYFRSPGQRKNRHIYDSTAVIGLQRFANRIQASVVPSWQQWMHYAPGQEIPEEDHDAIKEGLEEATGTFFAHLNHSNFSTEITPALQDLGVGTGAIIVEEAPFDSPDTLRFVNVPLAELYPEAPVNGIVESAWRKQKITPRNIMRAWPDAKLTRELETLSKNKPDEEVVIHNGMLFNTKDRKYHQVVLHNDDLIYTQSFDTKRMIVFRWHVTPGETYGRGPIMQQLPDIRTVNKVVEFTLQNAAIQMAGIYTGVDDGVFNPNTAVISPGVIMPVTSNSNQNPTLSAITPSGNLSLSDLVLGDLRENINKALLVNPLGDLTDPVRTATENLIRKQESLQQEGASFGRLKSELVEPLVEAVTDILVSLGKLPEIRVDGRDVTIVQESPLAQAEAMEDFQNSQLWWSMVKTMPEAVTLGSVKLEELPKYWAEKLSVPASLVRDDNERRQFGQQVLGAAEAAISQEQGNVPGGVADIGG